MWSVSAFQEVSIIYKIDLFFLFPLQYRTIARHIAMLEIVTK
jgi:hypothetical protein